MSVMYAAAPRISYGQHPRLGHVEIPHEKEHRPGQTGQIRLLVILVLFVLLLTIVSIIVSVVTITKSNEPWKRNYPQGPTGPHQPPSSSWAPWSRPSQSPVSVNTNVAGGAGRKDDRIYTIGFSDSWYSHEKLDSQTGALEGWGIEVVEAACKAANLQCRMMYTPWRECINYYQPANWQMVPILGNGLANNGLDACGGWFPDQERRNVAAFSDGWIRNPQVFLFYKGSNPGSGTALDPIKIGFYWLATWNEHCLRRYRTIIGNPNHYTFVSYAGAGQLVAALNAGSVKLIFLSDLNYQANGLTKYNDRPMTCSQGAAGLVASKKEERFLHKFSKGLEIIRGNGVLKKISDSIPAGKDSDWMISTFTN